MSIPVDVQITKDVENNDNKKKDGERTRAIVLVCSVVGVMVIVVGCVGGYLIYKKQKEAKEMPKTEGSNQTSQDQPKPNPNQELWDELNVLKNICSQMKDLEDARPAGSECVSPNNLFENEIYGNFCANPAKHSIVHLYALQYQSDPERIALIIPRTRTNANEADMQKLNFLLKSGLLDKGLEYDHQAFNNIDELQQIDAKKLALIRSVVKMIVEACKLWEIKDGKLVQRLATTNELLT